MDNMLEESAKKLSLKLAEKLEKKEISIEQMAKTIDEFLRLSGQAKELKEVEDFVKKI
jgi:hypothetical protein